MIVGDLAVKKYVDFGSAKINLDYSGITYVQAHNKDAQNPDSPERATNGAGKSVLFGAIPEIVWGESPTGKDKTKIKQKSSKLRIELKEVGKNNDTYLVTRTLGKKKSYSIQKNGKDIKVRTIALAQKRIKQLFGMSESDFYTRCYIDSLHLHPLITGSAAQRQEFFVDMFNLHSADSIRKLLTAEYREAQKHKSAYLEVKSLFNDLKDKTPKPSELEDKQSELKELTQKQERVLSKFRLTQKTRDLVTFESDNKALIAKAIKYDLVQNFEDTLSTLKRRLAKEKSKEKKLRAWSLYQEKLIDYRKSTKPVAEELDKIIGNHWRSEIDLMYRKHKLSLELQASIKSLTEQLKVASSADKPKKVEQKDASKSKCLVRVQRIREELQHIKQFKNGVCPTCGAKAKARDINEVKKDLSKWKSRLEQATLYEEYLEAKKNYKEKVQVKEELAKTLKASEDKLVSLEKWTKAYSLVRKLPDVPAPPGALRPDFEFSEDLVDKLKSRIDFADTVLPVVDKIVDVQNLSKSDRESAKDFDILGDKLTKLNNRVSNLTAEITSGQAALNQLSQLSNRGKALKKLSSDEPILKSLIGVYSNKGLKKLLIERHAKRLETQINKFRKLLFVEDFEFEFKYDKHLELLVHRKRNGYVKTSDVKKLSGAEKRLFTILLVVSTITLLPANKRLNLLILDEPEANLGPSALASFVKALPVLNKIVKHIVVVTPRQDLEIPGARVYTVVKERGESKLVKGRT